MKKVVGSRTLRIIHKIFNVRGWSDFDRIKEFLYVILHSLNVLFVPKKTKKSQDKFDAAVVNLQLTEEDLAIKQRALLHWSILMLLIFLCIFCYSIYQIIVKHYLAFMISCSLSSIALGFAFRYNFWSYQISQRRLGCSFKDWFTHLFSGGTL